MRLKSSLLLLLGLAATMFAADPFVGTWKMNPAKTKYKVGTTPKEQTVTITEAGGDLTVKVMGISSDGTKIAYGYTIPASGGTGKLLDGSPYDGVASKRFGPNEREVQYMKGGKQVYTTHSKVAADGSSLAVTAKGTGPLGKEVDGSVAYDKQK